METNDELNGKKCIKWLRICIITDVILASLAVIAGVLTILKEFTDLEEKVPFLYSKISACVLIVIFLAIFTFTSISYFKARKYKKLIEQSETEEENGQTDDPEE